MKNSKLFLLCIIPILIIGCNKTKSSSSITSSNSNERTQFNSINKQKIISYLESNYEESNLLQISSTTYLGFEANIDSFIIYSKVKSSDLISNIELEIEYGHSEAKGIHNVELYSSSYYESTFDLIITNHEFDLYNNVKENINLLSPLEKSLINQLFTYQIKDLIIDTNYYLYQKNLPIIF